MELLFLFLSRTSTNIIYFYQEQVQISLF